MTPEIEAKRRELFEEWAADESEIRQVGPTIGLLRDEHHDRYSMIWTQTAWVAFNAALEAVVIDLEPAIRTIGGGPVGATLYTPEVYAAIRSTGLGLKVTP